jgi:hypothetical protein
MISGTNRPGGPDDTFVEELSRLKRQGASVLVVGSTQASQRAQTCQQLFGHAVERPRRRILVSTAGNGPTAPIAANNHSEDRLRLINHDVQTRSAASAATSNPASSHHAVETKTLADLGVAISEAAETLETMAGGLEPSELRIGIDSLLPLIEEYGQERTFRFVHLTNGLAKQKNAMIHYHLPIERDATTVSVLSPLFDIVVELREQNGIAQERWSLKDETLCSGWIPTASS